MSPTNRPLFSSNQASSGATDDINYYRNEDNSREDMNRYIPSADQVAAEQVRAEAEADEIIRRVNVQVARNRQIEIAEIAVNNRRKWELYQLDMTQHQVG